MSAQRVNPLRVSISPTHKSSSATPVSSRDSSLSSSVTEWKYSSGNCYAATDDYKAYSSDFDDWEKKNNANAISKDKLKSSLARISLFRQFDPLVPSDSPTQMVNTSPHHQIDNRQNGFEWMSGGIEPLRPSAEQYISAPKPDVLPFAEEKKCDDNNLKELTKSCEKKLDEKDKRIDELRLKLETRESENQKLLKVITTMQNTYAEMVQMSGEVILKVEKENIKANEKCIKLKEERSKAVEDMNAVEKSFSDLHYRYDKIRAELSSCKEREERYKQQYAETVDRINKLDRYCKDLETKIKEQSKV